MPNEDISTLEKHGQTLLAAAILGAMTWMGSIVLSTNTDIKVLTEKVSSLEKQFTLATGDRYTRSDANADRRTTEQKFKSLEHRINKLEGFNK